MILGRHILLAILLTAFTNSVQAQELADLVDGLDITTEASVGFTDGKTPLWLNAGRHGLFSMDGTYGYGRITALRPIEVCEYQDWKIGYGVDVAVGKGYQQTVMLQQAFAEVGYKKVSVTAGMKYRPLEFKEEELTSGAMCFGNNARPIPQAEVNIDWFSIPLTRQFWKWRAHYSVGKTTDGKWQTENVAEGERYTSDILYQERALEWKFGYEDSETCPLTYELSLKFASQFGGTTYNAVGRGLDGKTDIKHPSDLQAFLTAFYMGGSDITDGSSKNTIGNHVGSWNMRLKWHGEDWSAAARFERFFEDQSMMFIQYGIYDHLAGLDLTLPDNRLLSSLTVEHMNTRDQSGAILHDEAPNIPDKMNGRDNYYNHNLYSGYQHWGQTMGNPLLTSPIYNSDGKLDFKNNRVRAWHIGVMGDPTDWLHWRLLASLTQNWGTYDHPLDDMTSQNYFLFETTIYPYSWNGWQVKAAIGWDKGGIVGNNVGGLLTVSRTITFTRE